MENFIPIDSINQIASSRFISGERIAAGFEEVFHFTSTALNAEGNVVSDLPLIIKRPKYVSAAEYIRLATTSSQAGIETPEMHLWQYEGQEYVLMPDLSIRYAILDKHFLLNRLYTLRIAGQEERAETMRQVARVYNTPLGRADLSSVESYLEEVTGSILTKVTAANLTLPSDEGLALLTDATGITKPILLDCTRLFTQSANKEKNELYVREFMDTIKDILIRVRSLMEHHSK